jgi:hypothetical protein
MKMSSLSGNNNIRKSVILSLLLVLTSSIASHAATVIKTYDIAAVPALNMTINAARFDQSLGTLKSILISLSGKAEGFVTATNTTSGDKYLFDVSSSGTVNLRYPNSTTVLLTALPKTTIDYTSGGDLPGQLIVYGTPFISDTMTANSSIVTGTLNNSWAYFNNFIGSSTDTVAFKVNGSGSFTGSAQNLISTIGDGNLSAQINITYTYDAVPEPTTYVLLGISLGCVGFVRYRMTRGQALQTA